jgi:putative membrane protein
MIIRRNMLAGVAGAGFASALLRPAAAQPTTAQGAMSPADVARDALGDMAFALATSQLAMQRAENPMVRTFAQMEAEEQMAFTEARRMAGLPLPAPSMMDSGEQQMTQQLQSMNGARFDRMYIQGQIRGHQELLNTHSAIAQSGATREERMLATVAVPAIKTHLSMLQGIQQQMRG